jgi:hypothetical protein
MWLGEEGETCDGQPMCGMLEWRAFFLFHLVESFLLDFRNVCSYSKVMEHLAEAIEPCPMLWEPRQPLHTSCLKVSNVPGFPKVLTIKVGQLKQAPYQLKQSLPTLQNQKVLKQNPTCSSRGGQRCGSPKIQYGTFHIFSPSNSHRNSMKSGTLHLFYLVGICTATPLFGGNLALQTQSMLTATVNPQLDTCLSKCEARPVMERDSCKGCCTSAPAGDNYLALCHV